MSLHEIFMQRAVLQHQNELNSDNAGLILQSMAEGVAKGIQEEQARVQKQRDDERESKKAIEMFNKISGSGGTLIPSLDMKDGKFKVSASTPSISETKAQFELKNEQGFVNDIQSGMDASALYLKYPGKVSAIDELRKAGTIKMGGTSIPMNTPIVSSATPSVAQDSVTTGTTTSGFKWIPKDLDPLGRPTGWTIDKPSSAQETRNVETQELSNKLQGITKLFVKARKEASSVEGFGKPGVEGRIAGIEAIVKGKTGDSPAVNVFNDNVDAFATTTAKAAGEVRPTDEDIKRFSKAMMSMYKTDAENAMQLALVLDDIKAKGHSVSWAYPLIKEFENETKTKVDFNFDNTSTTPHTKMIGGYKVRIR